MFFYLSFLLVNPFLIDFSKDASDTLEIFKDLEKELSLSSIRQDIHTLFLEEKNKLALTDGEFETIYGHIHIRVSKGIDQKFYSHETTKGLLKINKGGNQCVVTTVDLSGRRNPGLIQQIYENLTESGFNGYLYYRIGGFPAPTNKELRYAAVPYSFKIFLMEEARLLGFRYVLWIDSRLIPMRSIEPIFSHIKKHRAFLVNDRLMVRMNFLSFGLENLEMLLGINPLNYPRIATPVFGLDMESSCVRQLVQDYYTCCENGLCFLSVFPEEHVLSTIVGKYSKEFKYLYQISPSTFKYLWHYDKDHHLPESLIYAVKQHFYFYGVGAKSQYMLKELGLKKFVKK
ncbi:MAG: hypothetical protein KGQ54_01200 [Verrucomicrobia bacterium]|nr:hypothetical protein [Verrucomicrobiota bacterium]NDE63061.1 hypothetical protein [Chlamydiota bacterium]